MTTSDKTIEQIFDDKITHLRELISIRNEESKKALESANINLNGRLSMLESLTDSKMKGTQTALEVKAVEMERRLEALNQLRSEVIKDRSVYIRNDVYDVNHAQLTTTLNTILQRIAVNESDRTTIISQIAYIEEMRKEINFFREHYLKVETYDVKTAYYDTFVNTTANRLTAIETKTLTWTAAIALFVVIMNFAMFFVERMLK